MKNGCKGNNYKKMNKAVEALERMLGHLEHELTFDDPLVVRCKELIKEYSQGEIK